MMEKWEKKYAKALVEALHPFGDLLQVGCCEILDEMQQFHLKSHTLIEPDPLKVKKLKKNSRISLIEEPWQMALPRLGVFDAIFFGGNTAFGELKKMRYSEADIAFLCEGVGRSEELGRFLYELEHGGQISSELRKKMVKKYRLKTPKAVGLHDETLSFLQQCLESHMRKGSRFTCFLQDATSKFEDKRFFEEIIMNPGTDYHERTVFFLKREALVVFVEKV